MLEKLTDEQKNKLPHYRDKWMAVGTFECDPEFYSDEINAEIRKAIVGAYKAAKYKILPDDIEIHDSLHMALFAAAGKMSGKPGKPAKPLTCKVENIVGKEVIENYVNSFKNPMDVIKTANEMLKTIYWGMPEAGFFGYLDFFKSETDINVDFTNSEFGAKLTCLTHAVVMVSEKICCVAKRPVVLRIKDGSPVDDGKPYLIYADGIGIFA